MGDGPPVLPEGSVAWLMDIVMSLPDPADLDPVIANFKQKLQLAKVVPLEGKSFEMYTTKSGAPIAITSQYRLYPCRLPDKRWGLMKISADKGSDGSPLSDAVTAENAVVLQKEAKLLMQMRQESLDWDEEVVMLGEKPALHHSAFPEVVASGTLGGRWITVLGYPSEITVPVSLSPISRLMASDAGPQRIDLKSLGWVLNKLLKCLNFAHQHGYLNNQITAQNVLLLTQEHHGVILFNWTKATKPTGDFPYGFSDSSEARVEVQAAIRIAVSLAGGKMVGNNLELPFEDVDAALMTAGQHEALRHHLEQLLRTLPADAYREHQSWYNLVKSIWGITFHEFQLYPA